MAIVWAPNMSVGVNLLLGLVEQVARTLDPAFDIEILEMHHRHKVDAPSGTALALGRAAARGRGGRARRRGRAGARRHHRRARQPARSALPSCAAATWSATTAWCSPAQGERIELAHLASDRRIYSLGAVRAAMWAGAQPPGLYGMGEVLGLRAPPG